MSHEPSRRVTLPASESSVVTCFLRHDGEVLLLRRSEKVGSYRGRWGAVAGYVEDTPDASARREIREETGLEDHVRLVRRGDPFTVDDAALERRWHVHPYLFDCDRRDARLDWESVEAEWVSPTEIRRRETVPQLWTSYEHVAPTVSSIVEDREHGSTYLSLRALEVLRDRASAPEVLWEELRELARSVLAARPSMTALANRIHRVMHAVQGDARRVEEEAQAAIARAVQEDGEAARRASDLVAGRRVLTLSRSETVTAALLDARPAAVVVAESRPGLEGAQVADTLKIAGVEVTLIPDASMGAALSSFDIDIVLVGADAVLASGAVVNKVGTRLLALAAREEQISVYVVSAEDKIDPRNVIELESSAVPGVPLFEVTPAGLLTGIVTEHGVLAPDAVAAVASGLEALADWVG